MPVASIVSALSGIKAATDIAKLIKDAGVTLEAADHKLQIAELVGALADSKMALVEIQDLLRDKDDQINSLKDSLKTKLTLIRHNDAYYEKDEHGKASGSPYCSPCFEKHNIIVHINQNPLKRQTSICPSCKNTFAWQRRIVKDEIDV